MEPLHGRSTSDMMNPFHRRSASGRIGSFHVRSAEDRTEPFHGRSANDGVGPFHRRELSPRCCGKTKLEPSYFKLSGGRERSCHHKVQWHLPEAERCACLWSVRGHMGLRPLFQMGPEMVPEMGPEMGPRPEPWHVPIDSKPQGGWVGPRTKGRRTSVEALLRSKTL